MEGLFLDDRRDPRTMMLGEEHINWNVVRNYDEFVSFIERVNKLPDIITFDHDLNDQHTKHVIDRLGNKDLTDYSQLEKTGFHCAKWLCNYCEDKEIKLPEIITVHSANPCGADNIVSYLNSYAKHSKQFPKIYKTVW